jgi:hypothetical protein
MILDSRAILYPIFVAQGKSQTRFRVGYINYDGLVVIEPVYSFGTLFYEGLAAVQVKGGRWGVIKSTGDFVIPPTLWNWCRFQGGLASLATRTGKYGVINQDGEFVIPPTYEYIGPFQNELALIRKGEERATRFGFINKTGAEAIPVKFHGARGFSGGLAAARIVDLWGYVLPSGVFKITPRFNGARIGSYSASDLMPGFFADGLAPVFSDHGDFRFVGTTGQFEFDIGFDKANSFREGLALVKRGKIRLHRYPGQNDYRFQICFRRRLLGGISKNQNRRPAYWFFSAEWIY